MSSLSNDAKADLLSGAHVCRHSEGAAAVSSDQFGEQTYIKQGKQAGGLKGISTNCNQVAVWIESFGVCSQVSEVMDSMYDHSETSFDPKTRHKEEGEHRKTLDEEDRKKILNELEKHSHPLKPSSTSLYNIFNGRVSTEEDVNVHNAVAIGEEMGREFANSLPTGFHKPIKKVVKTMQGLKRGIQVKDKMVYDLHALFSRFLVVGQMRNIDISLVFQHELCPVPPSLIDEYGCLRKGNKSELVKRLGSDLLNARQPDVLLVDASQLLYHIVWPSSGTVADIAKGMKTRLERYNAETYVIFDRYDGVSAKDHERSSRAGEGSSTYQLTLSSPVPVREVIMKNTKNKKQLAELLCLHDLGSRISLVSKADSIVSHDEADISIISYVLQAASSGAQAIRVLSDDTDIFVLLVFWCWKLSLKCQVQMEKWDGMLLDINATVNTLGEKSGGLLGMHALSGCDTTSFPNGKGKVSALNVLLQNDIPGLYNTLGEEEATDSDLIETGNNFFLALYGQKKSTSLNEARHNIFFKRKNPPKLKCLPPTNANLALHIKRAHLQAMLWKAADKCDPPHVDIKFYGWEIDANSDVMPMLSKNPIAPKQLLDIISCNCRAAGKACAGRCGCNKNGLACTKYCFCEGGDDCFNPLTQRGEGECGEDDIEDFDETVNEADDSY